MQAVEGAGGSSAVVRRIAAVGEPDAVPAFAQAAVAATLSAAARQEFVRPPVLMPCNLQIFLCLFLEKLNMPQNTPVTKAS